MIRIKNLNKYFNNHKVLENINLDIKKGEIVSLVGPSGHGKTTLLRCIQGLEKYEGEIIYKGKVAFVFQHFYLFPHMTVMENLCYAPLKIQGKNAEHVRNQSKKLLAALHMEDKLDNYPNSLSGGQKQRVAIARTLMTDPDILLLDEPTSALDSDTSDLLINILEKLNKKGMTIIFVSHDKLFEEKLAKKCYKLARGKIIEIKKGE